VPRNDPLIARSLPNVMVILDVTSMIARVSKYVTEPVWIVQLERG
jgi:hypothetical protein